MTDTAARAGVVRAGLKPAPTACAPTACAPTACAPTACAPTAYDPERHHRRSIRLKGYDYSQEGLYFVTICVQNRQCLFGEVVAGRMHRNAAGEMVQAVWDDLPHHYSQVQLDAFVVMPNHVHGIVVLTAPTNDVGTAHTETAVVGAGFKPAPTAPIPNAAPIPNGEKRHGLPEIVRAFKTFSARRVNGLRQTPGVPVWQRNYYEHIIRNEIALNRIRGYIAENAARWPQDPENPTPRGRTA